MTSDSDIDTWHYNATWHWQCRVALTMPRVTHRDLTRGIFNFFLKNQKNHRLTRGTLTNGVSQLCLKGT